MSSVGVAMREETPPLERRVLAVPALGRISLWWHVPLSVIWVGSAEVLIVSMIWHHLGIKIKWFAYAVGFLTLYGPFLHEIWTSRRKYQSLESLIAGSEIRLSAESKKVGEYSSTTDVWLMRIALLFFLLMNFDELISFVKTGDNPRPMLFLILFVPVFWSIAIMGQKGKLELRESGLVWYQLITTEFIPWCAVREWGFRGDPRESVLTIQVVKKKGEMEEEKIGLLYLDEGERERVRELMEEYCGEGVLSGKARA